MTSNRIRKILAYCAVIMLASPMAGSQAKAISAVKPVKLSSVSIQFSGPDKTGLRASNVVATPKTAVVTYQWFQDGLAIKGAKTAAIKLNSTSFDSSFQVRVSASAKGFSTSSSLSRTFVPGDQPRQYKLVWSDEFVSANDGIPSSEVWSAQEGDGTEFGIPGWGNAEEQYYVAAQAKQLDGVLSIEATRSGAQTKACYYGTCQWLSSKLVTKNRIGFTHGRLEARIKTSLGQAVWPAFWLLGANIDTRPWPGCGEIDIMELKGQDPERVWGTIHGPNGSVGDVGGVSGELISGWHTYAIDWSPTAITWFIDGKRFNKITKKQYVGSQDTRVWVFDREFYLILNLAMGGNFVGGSTEPELKSANMQIDFVRYYSMDGIGNLTKR